MADSGDGVHKAGGFALSFKGKPRAVAFKVPVQPKAEEEKRELVTGISDSGRLRTAERKEKAAALVIPRQENTFQVGVGKTTTKSARAREARFLPTADDGLNSKTEDKFELAEEVPVDAKIGYGLTKFDGKAAAKEGKQNGGGGTALSQLMMSQQDKEAAQMKEDLERLPEQANMEAYEAMPIDKFGEAMLRGMGWRDGMNVGRNQSSVVQAVEYVARPGRLGLGAQPSAVDPKADRKHIRPGESRARKPDLVVARDADGRQRNVRRLDEKLVEREAPGARKGKTMWIASGEHRGFFCSVIDVDEVAGRAVVRLRPSEADVAVRTRELVEEWEREAAEAERGRPRSSHREGSREREREHKKSRHREKERDRRRDREPGEERHHKRSRRDESPPRQRGPSWLPPPPPPPPPQPSTPQPVTSTTSSVIQQLWHASPGQRCRRSVHANTARGAPPAPATSASATNRVGDSCRASSSAAPLCPSRMACSGLACSSVASAAGSPPAAV
mmetsp:Transcript_12936/g.33363  ORF Transcript_12936/g.33363 Transcript_12936/m.33363 type:complete len:503 (-) Transcript_12936:516-2024(-)